MSLKTFIIIGRSGSGKGTQASLLQEYIKKQSPESDILYVESGDKFREFLKGDTYSSALSKEAYMTDKLQPSFLSIWVWTDFLIKSLSQNQHLIFDGSPRKLNEALVLNEALGFYGRKNVSVIFINVSRDWATERLKDRKRLDDGDDSIKKRLDWFDKDVMPAIDFYKNNSQYNFLEINGEQSIEEVHNEIVSKLKT